MFKTKAAVVERPGAPFTVEEVELADLRPGEALVRIVAAGLCHTDLGVQAGGIPFALPGVLGHEGAGVVVATGPAGPRGVRRARPRGPPGRPRGPGPSQLPLVRGLPVLPCRASRVLRHLGAAEP